MNDQSTSSRHVDDEDLQKILEQTESSSRKATGISGAILIVVPLIWSLFQIWYSSDIPYWLGFGVFNDNQARPIHLAFAVFLALFSYPAFKNSPKDKVPWTDFLLAIIGAFSAFYLCLFAEQLAGRSGSPSQIDLVVASIGMVLLLEATRRALGPPLMVVAIIFLAYAVLGPYMPEVIAHKGQSFSKLLSHQWLSTEGVFGIALGVSTSFIFLFVLFGALLESSGAGSYFIKLAFALLGDKRGGPAKAAVVASGLNGIASGSSIANVASTGVFTIPLMKRVGFPGHKAGAIEVAASINGQVTPPVMGAAAFLMVEYVGIPYTDVIKHAILPALISYIALIYIVHLEASKANMQILEREQKISSLHYLLGFIGTILGLCVLGYLTLLGANFLKSIYPDNARSLFMGIIGLAYLGLAYYACNYPEATLEQENAKDVKVPPIAPTVKSGLHYLLPLVVLMWCLMEERFSPAKSAFLGTISLIFIVLTQRPLMSFFRKLNNKNAGDEDIKAFAKQGFCNLYTGLVNGARNMIGIGVATAAAGIIVGVVTQTGLSLVMTDFVEFISGGSVILMLIMTAVICLILGMGLPTTANYITVSTIMAPVIVALGAQHGLVLPLIAVHMFVFYFGLLADSTPPVGLAAFAGAAIAKSDPIKTGIQGFLYNIRTAILPFMFIFNTQLLLIDIGTVTELLLVIASAIVAMLIFAAATQGYWLTKSRLWESLALLLIAFALFRPGFFMDMIYPPYDKLPGNQVYQVAEQLPENAKLRIYVKGKDLEGDTVRKLVVLPLQEKTDGISRLKQTGLELLPVGDAMLVDLVEYDSVAQNLGLDIDWKITRVEKPSDVPSKQWVFLPALLLLMLIGLLQRERQASEREKA